MSQDRYHRQVLLPQIGPARQEQLDRARALLIGCGALGTVVAEQLARAGVGRLRIADRDVVEVSNLQRQVLFDEADARDCLPKAVAAARRLSRINSMIEIDSLVVDVDSENLPELAKTADVIVDGTDNIETRYLINDVSVRDSIPWIYGGCVGTEGRVMTVIPGETPCLRCVFPEPPSPGELPTCDTAGVLGPAAGIVGSIQAVEALKLLSRNFTAVARSMTVVDVWTNRFREIDLTDARRLDCPTCGRREFTFLDRPSGQFTARLCGRGAVQVRPPPGARPTNLDEVATRLRVAGAVTQSPFLVRCALPDSLQLTVFADGRIIVHGTNDPGRARSIYARYLGA
jgi:adenylyltransferase/sulfurtransferase